MMDSLDKNNKTFPHHYQNMMIVKELHNCFGEMYLGKNTITTDGLFIITNIRIYCHMDVAKFEGLLYTILSKELFKNHIIHIIEKKMIILYLIIFISTLVC